jgi:hypothetical protein
MSTKLLQAMRDADQRHVLNLARDFDGDNTGAANVADSLNALAARFRRSIVDSKRAPLFVEIPPESICWT